jgi:hypothetical protein
VHTAARCHGAADGPFSRQQDAARAVPNKAFYDSLLPFGNFIAVEYLQTTHWSAADSDVAWRAPMFVVSLENIYQNTD